MRTSSSGNTSKRVNLNPDLAPWDRSQPRIDELECDTDSMQIAVTLVEWFKYETKRVYATWGGLADETPTPKGDGLQQRIIDHLEHKGGAVTLRDLQRKCKVDKETAVAATDVLLQQGLVERLEPKKLNCGPMFRLCSNN